MIGGEEFDAYFPEVSRRIAEYLDKINIKQVKDHVMKMISQTCHGGKQARGKLAVSVFLELTGYSPKSREAEIGYVIGWTMELLQTAYLIADDLMDQSSTRRGQKCWYLNENVGDSAVNDGLLLENLAIMLIQSISSSLQPRILSDLISGIRKTALFTTMGQTYDYIAKDFTFECYEKIVTYKTSYYTILLPIICGMIGSGKYTIEESTSAFLDLSLRIGYLFQAQDDFIDVYGDPEITGKCGTDIRDRKITWLVCKAYEDSNEDQKSFIDRNYGVEGKEDALRSLFDELSIPEKFNEFQAKEVREIQMLIDVVYEKYHLNSIQAIFDKIKDRKY